MLQRPAHAPAAPSTRWSSIGASGWFARDGLVHKHPARTRFQPLSTSAALAQTGWLAERDGLEPSVPHMRDRTSAVNVRSSERESAPKRNAAGLRLPIAR